MLTHSFARWLPVAALVAVCGVVSAFVLGEFARGQTVPTVAGAVIGGASGAFLAGVRTRVFDAMFPPGETEEE